MGRDLHYTIRPFIERNITNHAMVESWERIDDLQEDDAFMYLVKRRDGLSDVLIYVSDAYCFTMNDYYQKPAKISEGAFIYIARPEATYDWDIAEIAEQEKISIGKFGALMGVLYKDEHWSFIPKERRDDD